MFLRNKKTFFCIVITWVDVQTVMGNRYGQSGVYLTKNWAEKKKADPV